MTPAVSFARITKTFGETLAVDQLDLTIPAGALYGFIGPNGAGKTTAIRMLMSILFPDSGELTVLGAASALDAKNRIGYLPEERGVYKNMKVGAYLKFIARLKSVPEEQIQGRIDTLLQRVQLPDVAGKRCEDLSKGMRQKIQFAAAIINQPELLILDEPFSGLDPVNLRLLRDLIVEENARGATILFSTHVMLHAEEICDHIVMMHQGRKVIDMPVSAIRGQFDSNVLVVEPQMPGADAERLGGLVGVVKLRERDNAFELTLSDGTDTIAVMQRVVQMLPVARIELKRPRLEDIFIRIVAGDSIDDEAALRRNLNADPPGAAVA